VADLLTGGRDRPPRRWVTAVVVLGLLGGGLAFAATRGSGSDHPTAAPTPTPTNAWTAIAGPTPTPHTVVTDAGHSLLGIKAGWELFGRGDNVVVRIQLARGVITRTPVPTLTSSGPVSFLVGPDRAIIRPLDRVSGYVVADGKQARQLTGALDSYGPALPGSNPSQVWAADDRDPNAMTLVDMAGRPAGQSIPLPAEADGVVVADGAGYVMFSGTAAFTTPARPAFAALPPARYWPPDRPVGWRGNATHGIAAPWLISTDATACDRWAGRPSTTPTPQPSVRSRRTETPPR